MFLKKKESEIESVAAAALLYQDTRALRLMVSCARGSFIQGA